MNMAKTRYMATIRSYAQNSVFGTNHIRYETKEDERYDLTLVSRRVYGISSEWLTIQAAAGMSTPEDELPPQTLVLPSFQDLIALKKQAGL